MFESEGVKDMEVSDGCNSSVPMQEDKKIGHLKPKFHLLKKIFMPWKWKKKKKSEKFNAISKTLERKISVRISKDQLVEMGLIPSTELDQIPVPTEAPQENRCYDGEDAAQVKVPGENPDEVDACVPPKAVETSWVCEVGVVPPPEMFSPPVPMVEVESASLRPQMSLSSAGDGLDLSDNNIAVISEQIDEEVHEGVVGNIECYEAINPMIDCFKNVNGEINDDLNEDLNNEVQHKFQNLERSCMQKNTVMDECIEMNADNKIINEDDVNSVSIVEFNDENQAPIYDYASQRVDNYPQQNETKNGFQRVPLRELVNKNQIHQIGQEEWRERRDRIGRRLEKRLSTRPSVQEMRERNLIPKISQEEKEDLKRRISVKLERRLSIRPTETDLTERNILRFETDEQVRKKHEEKKVILQRKLSIRPSVAELRKRKILKFSEFIDVVDCQEYDRSADKPWTRLTPRDKASIRKELNDFKSLEMEVHSDSRHLTRFHKP